MIHNNHNHNRRSLLLVLLAVTILLAGTASAGWFGKKKDDGAKMPSTKRYHVTARQSYVRGELQQGSLGQWILGQRSLQLSPKCLVLAEDGTPGHLVSGATVIVAGTVIGDMVIATQVRQTAPDWKTPPNLNQEGRRIASDSDPDVGLLEDAPK